MYLMVQVIFVLFLRTEPAVILLCAAVLSVPELSEVRLGKYRNVKPASVAGIDMGLNQYLKTVVYYVVLTED